MQQLIYFYTVEPPIKDIPNKECYKRQIYTVEPPNKGHVGDEEVSFIRRLKCTGIIGIGTSRFVLHREVSFIGGSTV